MYGSSRPWRPQHTCSNCGEEFELHYDWRHHYCHGNFERMLQRSLVISDSIMEPWRNFAVAVGEVSKTIVDGFIPVMEELSRAVSDICGAYTKALEEVTHGIVESKP